MKLLITNHPNTQIWEYNDGYVSLVNFEDYNDHDLCNSSVKVKRDLPMDIVIVIIKHLIDIYIETRNFDLANEVLLVSRWTALYTYQSFFKASTIPLVTKISRLSSVFSICQSVHDEYITNTRKVLYSGINIVKKVHRSNSLDIWEYNRGCLVQKLPGHIYNDNVSIHDYTVGDNYGNQVWLAGNFQGCFFNCIEILTPILNFIMIDEFGTLTATEDNLKDNDTVYSFCKILRQAYGPRTAINFMIREDPDEDNIFVTSSSIFYSF